MPVRLLGRRVRVLLHASEVVIYDGRTEVACHERLVAKGAVRLDLDHYLCCGCPPAAPSSPTLSPPPPTSR
ncbi:Mu transposase domain-containing protein [Streptomyces coacervatus]|uniref:Mu transposase domain-containing protein n=1 Tax=Streptomyces coacervatus TaxID=647381 RepID=UPI003CD0836B